MQPRERRPGLGAFAVSSARWSFACAWIVTLVARVATAQSPPPDGVRSSLAGVYSQAQADKGKTVFANLCTGCHNVASHTGPKFQTKWGGRLAWDLYDTILGTMPDDNIGSLNPPDVVLVVAYVLKLNGLPAGTTNLPSDDAGLKKIRLEFPEKHP